MNKIGIIGNQIKYTLSPKIHEFFARQSQIEINYQVIDCEPESFEIEVIKFFQDTNAVGLNVTIPYKEDALKISLTKDIQAEKSNSCNTLYKNGNILEAYSTDGEGFLTSIEKFLEIKHKNILIIGAGGSARSVGVSLLRRGGNIFFINRDQNKLKTLPSGLENLVYQKEKIDLLVSCIPSSAANFIQAKIISKEILLNHEAIFVDLSYINSIAYDQEISKHFALTLDGMGMLAHQAALSFKIWFGVEVDPLAAISYVLNEKN